MTSLRTRAVAGGIVWAVFSILIGVFGLASFLDTQTQSRFDQVLLSRHVQAVVSLSYSAGDADRIATGIVDPVYQRPLSGQYWQMEGPQGQVIVSKSLAELLLPRPTEPNGDISISNISGTASGDLRRIEEWVTLDDGSTWHVQVASSLAELRRDRTQLRKNLLLSFGLITVVGVMGVFLQASTTLRPLNDLRQDVTSRWDSEEALNPDRYPVEVSPLVSDINTLMDRNREVVSRSRRQAADLAHAVKTPSAIVRNELEKLRDMGQPVQSSIDALDRLDAQLKRSFARMRADGNSAAGPVFTDLDNSLGRMVRAFGALARNQNLDLVADVAPGLRVRMDQSDFEEVLGNLMDNAVKWATSKIRISAKSDGQYVQVVIEDDGTGIPEDEYGTATLSGQRLDTSKPGTGLGLAIAADLAHAYGGKINLGRSEALGGLSAIIRLKNSGV